MPAGVDSDVFEQLMASVERFARERLIPAERRVEEEDAIPEEIVSEMKEMGLFGLSTPEEFGGIGINVPQEARLIEALCYASLTFRSLIGTNVGIGSQGIVMDGTQAQKEEWLPGIASGELRLQSMAVTEPTTGTDTTKLKTTAVKKGDRYLVNGQKVWISRIQHSDLMILLARTTPINEVKRKAQGLSIFMVDLKKAIGNGMRVSPIANMPGHETCEVFFDELEIPEENLIGEEGRGFYHILDGLNAERTLIAAECIGDGYWFIDKARAYAGERIVFNRPIGQNQGVQFPLARAYVNVEAANLMRFEACRRFDAHEECGAQANMTKLLAADASWEAANACLQT